MSKLGRGENMFGADGIGVEFVSDLISAVGDIVQVVMEPPFVYFLLLGLIAIAAKLIRKFVRIKAK